MAYITKFEGNKKKDELIYDLKNIPETIKISNIETFKIGNFIISKKEEGYISGKISVRRNFDDFIRKHQAIGVCPYELATDIKLDNPNKWMGLIELSKNIF